MLKFWGVNEMYYGIVNTVNWRNRRILEAWKINTYRNPLNRDDGMHLPHEFLNLALSDRT